MRIVKVFWGLDSSLAYARHFPAINWLTSYSLYTDGLKSWFDSELGVEFMQHREQALSILQEESNLQEIVKLVGQDALSVDDRLTLETAKMIREDFLQQNAFVDVDSYSSYERQEMLLAIILEYDKLCRDAVKQGAELSELFAIPAREQIGRAKSVPADEYTKVYAQIRENMKDQIADTISGGAQY